VCNSHYKSIHNLKIKTISHTSDW